MVVKSSILGCVTLRDKPQSPFMFEGLRFFKSSKSDKKQLKSQNVAHKTVIQKICVDYFSTIFSAATTYKILIRIIQVTVKLPVHLMQSLTQLSNV